MIKFKMSDVRYPAVGSPSPNTAHRYLVLFRARLRKANKFTNEHDSWLSKNNIEYSFEYATSSADDEYLVIKNDEDALIFKLRFGL